MKKNIQTSLIILYITPIYFYSQFWYFNPYVISRITANPPHCGKQCEAKVKVIDERPFSCNYNGEFDRWYRVIYEEFNSKEDIPNEWMFNRDGVVDDQLYINCDGGSYYGSGLFAYNNGNFYINNGIGYLKVKKELLTATPNNNCPNKLYHFTNAVLFSEFNIKQGWVVSELKIPDNPYMWPAFWLQKKYPSSGYSEIDVFEFYDHNWNSNCDDYHIMRMTIHGFNVCCSDGHCDDHCHRGRRRPFNDFSNFHTFSLFMTDYYLKIQVDNDITGIATKYYDNPWHTSPPNIYPNCLYDADAQLPNTLYYCNNLQNLQGCNIQCWGGIFGNTDCCWQYNHVYKDLSFPQPSNYTYQVRISNWLTNQCYPGICDPINGPYLVNKLENEWNNFSETDKQIGIDYISVYQPIKCYKNQAINSFNDFVNETGHTNFLSGSKISLSNYHITPSDVWPTYLLATDEIEIKPNINDVAFEEGTFLRAEIIDCNTGISDVSQRISYSNNVLPPVLPMDHFDQQDSTYMAMQNFYNSPLTSETDNGALQIFPNPSSTHFHISMTEEDFNNLKKIELVNALDQTKELPMSETQNISDLAEGVYMVKFYFNTGMLVVKSLVIKR